MRVVLDTNILVSALLGGARPLPSPPAAIVAAWRARRFDLLTARGQLDELIGVLARPKIRDRLAESLAQALVDEVHGLAVFVEPSPGVSASTDPDDNLILAIAQAGQADYLVTGDKTGLLELGAFGCTQIVSARAFVDEMSGADGT